MDPLSISKKILWVWIAITILAVLAAFASGYIYRGQNSYAPIVIEKCS